MKIIYKIFLAFTACLLGSAVGMAQQISGQIKDAASKPVAGVQVIIKGKTVAVVTGPDGHFALPAAKTDTLVLSKPGFLSQYIAVHNGTIFMLTLRPEVEQLAEVKIVSNGYQSLPVQKATGSFEQVDKQLLNRSVGTDVLSRLEGVSTVQFDKRQGQSNGLVIRGHSTLFANSAPLVVLDNFPYNGDISNLNPNDVESITILKDAAAAAIWGVRASNGVLVITTKKGSRNKPLSVNFNANVTVADKPDLFYQPRMSSAAFVDLEKQLFTKGFYTDDESAYNYVPVSPVMELLIAQRDGKISTSDADAQIAALAKHDVRKDLQKYWYQRSVNQQYAVSLSGGSDKAAYLFSAGYDRNLTSLGGTYRRINLRTDNSFFLTKGLQLDVSAYLTSSMTVAGRDDFSALRTSGSKGLLPYASFADAQGNPLTILKDYRRSFVESSQVAGFQNWDYVPLDDYKSVNNQSRNLNIFLNTALKYQVVKGLGIELRYQLENAQTQGDLLYGQNSYYARNLVNQYTQTNPDGSLALPVPIGGVFDAFGSRLASHSIRTQLNYNMDWGLNRLTALAGYEYRTDNTRNRNSRDYGYNSSTQTALPVDYVTSFFQPIYSYYIDSTIPYVNQYQTLQNNNLSYFANAAYAFDDRYSLSASLRKDQSNLFGVNANQKGVPLYSVGAAWTLNNEKFYHIGWLPYLKLRASFGYSGNVDNTLSALTTIQYLRQNFISKQTSASIRNPPNPDLGWEKTGIINIGLDFALAGNVISGSVEYYRKKSDHLIGFQPLEQTTGVLNPATNLFQYKGNVAAMQGNGLELNLHSTNLKGSLKWHTDLLLSSVRNKVTSYYQYSDNASVYVANGYSVAPLVGKPVFAILTYKWAGLDPANGNPRGYVNGQVSSDYSAILSDTKVSDLQYSGSAVPQLFGYFRNTFTYQGISLSANIAYKLDYYFVKPSIAYSALYTNWDVSTGDYARRWLVAGDETKTNVPSMVYPADSQRDQFYNQSAANVEKGGNIRLQDIRLGYELSSRLLKQTPFKQLQVYGYASNLGLIWKATKTNYDPDYPLSFRPPLTVALGLTGNF
ncbi:TonB-linked SusC/RagA family outer membrane protein [Mucilaginibacter sp. UYP25]|uniref:SusC/RagA family TonB-linked outer membrane protein n=1 Tax=unclassified Mucilaginibacter TaxID=2617802 RepID=UPI0033932662